MPGHRAAVELLLVPAVEHATGVVAGLVDADLDRPSPCPGWTVRAVLQHLVESLDVLAAALDEGRVPVDTPPRPVPDRALAVALRTAGTTLVSAARRDLPRTPVQVAGLPLDRRHLVVVGAVEAAVHAWDAGRGADRARPVPDVLAERLLAELPRVADRGARAGSFAAAVPLPPSRPPADRLLAALGRHPDPDHPGPPGPPNLPTDPWKDLR